MQDLFQVFLIIHFFALAVGTATTVAMPVVMSRVSGASPDGRQMLAGIGARLSLNSRIALGVLVLSGMAMVWARYGGVAGMNGWFWAKMALVALLLLTLVIAASPAARAFNPRVFGLLTRFSLAGIIIAAVLAFS